MSNLQEILNVTTKMIEVLEQFEKDKIDRTATIEIMNELIEIRGELMLELKPPYSEEERQKGQQIIQLNNIVSNKMNELYNVVKEDMNKVKKKKAFNPSYINPYGKIRTTDGLYIDSKK